MTVVYIDLVFLLNLIANYLLLLGTGRVAGAVLRRRRIAAGAAVGAVYASLVFLPGLSWLSLWPCKILSGIVMPLIAYGRERQLLRLTVIFFGASAGLAGAALAAQMLGESALILENGVLYSDFDLRLLLLLFVLCYFVMSLFFRRAGQRIGRELVRLKVLMHNLETVELTALIDSGHSLTDPADNRPVVVVEGQRFAGYLPSAADLTDPVGCIAVCRTAGVHGVCLIPYRAVGVECGMLLALRAKSVTVGDKRLGGLLIALSPTALSDGGAYQALIGGI